MITSPNQDLALVIQDLLAIAKAAMPSYIYESDRRVSVGRDALDQLRSLGTVPANYGALRCLDNVPISDEDVADALDLFINESGAPATRSEAVSLILRDWLAERGYLEAMPDRGNAP